MFVYLFIVVLFIVFGLTVKDRWVLIALFVIAFFTLGAFRNLELGLGDVTGTFYKLYNELLTMPLWDIPNRTLGTGSILFSILTRILQQLFEQNYYAYIVFLSGVFAIFPSLGIYKFAQAHSLNNTYILIAGIIYMSAIFFFSFTFVRQFIAMGILIAMAYPALEKQHAIQFAIAVLFAGLFHNTAFVFLLVYPLAKYLRFSQLGLIIVLIVAFIGIVFPDAIIKALSALPFLEQRMSYVTSGVYSTETTKIGYGTFFATVLLTVFCYWVLLKQKPDKTASGLLWIVCLGVVFQGWSHVIVEFYRVALYFFMFTSYLVPYCLSKYSKKEDSLVNMGTIVVFVMYMIFININNAGVNPYILIF